MTSRRNLLLDAAIDIIGQQGTRQLTHRAVDAAAGVPAGTTSNHFRTREALIDGVVERFTAREQAAWEAIAARVNPGSAGELAAALAAFSVEATGPQRTLTLARYAILIEAALRPGLQERLAHVALRIRQWGARWLEAAGSADPQRHAQLLLDQLDGLILHQLAFPDPRFDPAARLAALVTALVGPH